MDGEGRTILMQAHRWLVQLNDDLIFVLSHVQDLSLDAEILDGCLFFLFVQHDHGSEMDLTREQFADCNVQAVRAFLSHHEVEEREEKHFGDFKFPIKI